MTRSDLVSHSTAEREYSARSSESVQSLRHGSQQNTKHGANTWPSQIKTRSLPSIRVPKETILSWNDSVIKARPKSNPDLSNGRLQFHAYIPRPMGEEPHIQDAKPTNDAQIFKPEEVKSSEKNTEAPPDKRVLKRARRDVASLRDALFRRRLWLKETRNALHEERTNVADLEADIMTSIRRSFTEILVSGPILAQDHYTELKQKVNSLEAKRDELGELQCEYDRAEIDHNVKETELNEEEQTFENLLFDVLGLSDSSDDSTSSDSIPRDVPQPIHSETPLSPSPKPNRAYFLASRLRTKSDSALTKIREMFPTARPRTNWWILHTFGCSPIDYVQRARDKALLQSLNDVFLDDENWAKLVFDYWGQGTEPVGTPNSSDGSWAELSTQDVPEPRHIRRITVGGSYLLLSSELTKARHTVDNYDLLFPADPGFHQNFVLQTDSVSKDLDSLSHHVDRSESPVSAPAVLNSPKSHSAPP